MAREAEVDAVYTWVDGGGLTDLPIWRTRLAGALDDGDVGAWRWRDNQELRFSLRSLVENAPWIRRVHIVTNGQVPAWLDRTAAEIRVVTHAELFPDPLVLPTFNSCAIEAVLHRIPGLAERYVYLNDDVILGRPVGREDFFTADGGTVVYVEPWDGPRSLDRGHVVDRALAISRLRLAPRPFRMLAHAPRAFERSRVEELWREWEPALRATLTHRFRSTDDFLLPVIYANALLARGAPHTPRENVDGLTRMIRVSASTDVVEVLAELDGQRPISVTFNDEVDDLGRDGWIWDLIRDFLERRHPAPSRFELAA
jgi:hypothetical protein